MGVDIGALTGAACAIAGAVISYLAFFRSARHDADKSGRETGAVLTELGYIKSSIDEINHKMDAQEARNYEFFSRLSAVEASAKQAHKRIDDIDRHSGHAGRNPLREDKP